MFTCAMIAAPLGIAGSGSARDRAGDVEGEPTGGASQADIVRTAYGHTKDGRLWHKVTVAGTAADPSKGGLVPAIFIEMREWPSATPLCDIYVGLYRGRPAVYACGTNERLGSARIVKSGKSTTKFVFSQTAIGKPERYEWAAGVIGPSDGTQVWHDRAPDQDDIFYTHELR